MSIPWHEPDVSTIHLANGQAVQAEVNGRDWESTRGFVFVQGRDIKVKRIAETDEWTEEGKQFR